MRIVDTAIWIDHFRSPNPELFAALEVSAVFMHPLVMGELVLGDLGQRRATLESFDEMPQALVAEHAEVLGFVEREGLFGFGIGYVDVHLVASALLMGDTGIWTRDRRLRAVATRFGVAA